MGNNMSVIRERNLARLVPLAAAATPEFTKKFEPVISNTPVLPAVNWAAIGNRSTLPTTPPGELPNADAVVITWTDAEWAALEHVFCIAPRP